jgi:deoxyribonuclease V
MSGIRGFVIFVFCHEGPQKETDFCRRALYIRMETILNTHYSRKTFQSGFPLARRVEPLLQEPWPESATEAFLIQQELRQKVHIKNNPARFRTIAGIDVSHDLKDNSHCAIVLMDLDSLSPMESIRISMPTKFPYIPGLLSFREIPVILKALSKLKILPDLLMVDGQGIAHPRRLGIAAHLGAILDMPAIGVAKSRLTGKYDDPAPEKGSVSPLMAGKEHIGTVLRSKQKCKPLFISPRTQSRS